MEIRDTFSHSIFFVRFKQTEIKKTNICSNPDHGQFLCLLVYSGLIVAFTISAVVITSCSPVQLGFDLNGITLVLMSQDSLGCQMNRFKGKTNHGLCHES